MDATRIRVLDSETAKRIAAGEVIDRPAAALRELLDNAIDSGATSIVVELEGGGADKLRVVDDGSGMGKDDIALSILPHATSKISSLDDLQRLATLGFRGEALSSMAAVARLEIVSALRDDEAWRLESTPGRAPTVSPSKGSRGTAITVADLFSSFPARKKFLKRQSAEAAACRAVLVDKAMAFPGVGFRLSSGGKSSLVLTPSSLVERALNAQNPDAAPEFFRELIASGTGFKARIVAGLPSAYRTDKRAIQVFVNGRRVQEYGIAQALEYSYRGVLPGGAWPFVYAFIDVDPEYADFNIHPAKKEVRLKNLDDIRSGLIRAIRDYLGNQARLSSPFSATSFQAEALSASAVTARGAGLFAFNHADYKPALSPSAASLSAEYHPSGAMESRERPVAMADESRSWSAIADAVARARREPALGARDDTLRSGADDYGENSGLGSFRYIGRALGPFIAFEDGDELVLLDQHAAHERYLYDEIMAGRAVSQELLVPVVYEAESDDEDAYIEAHAEALAATGFRLAREGGSWLLTAAPAMMPESMTGSVFELLRARPDPAELLRATAAQAACKAAIKDGDRLDESGAIALYRAALALPERRCPHGRPIWLRLSHDELFRAVRRIV